METKIIETEAYVVEVREEARDAKTIRLKPTEVAEFPFKSGQFIMVQFNEDPLSRAYSLSSSPTEKEYLEITVEDVGQFSHKLCSLQGGETLRIKGPYGTMVLDEQHQGPFVFIAGGSGIGPFLSMLKYIRDKALPQETYLFYTARVTDKLIAYKELQELEKTRENFHFHIAITRPHLENPPKWQGPTGRITIDLLKEKVKDFPQGVFYIVGPPPMVQDIEKRLQEEGIKQIKKEQW